MSELKTQSFMQNCTNTAAKLHRTHIKANQSWWKIDWREIWEYRDLLWMLVKRDLTAVYKQSVLGPLWFIIQPLATTIVFTVIFGNFAKISTEGTPPFLFYMSATIMWNYFAGCMNGVSGSLIVNAGIFSKVYFPRMIVPISLIISNLAQFALNFLTFLVFFLYFWLRGAALNPSWLVFCLPLLVLHSAVVGLGVGLWLSASTTKYRDLRFALPFLSQLWMYITPIVYPVSMVPERWRWILAINPMAAVTEFNRHAFLGSGHLNADWMIGSFVTGIVLLVTGVLAFNRIQRTFVDTV